ncbi:MAG: ATP-binding protein [bacterium]
MENKPIKAKERDVIIQSLKAGVVPRNGIHHIQVGRANEISALLKDIERISSGGSSIRFIIGDYGSGKTFFLNLIRTIANEKKCVATTADLSPDRKLFSTNGQARLLYSELMRNIAIRTKPEGGALPIIIERFISDSLTVAKNENKPPEVIIHDKLQLISEMVGGFDFADVIAAYWKGYDTCNDTLKSDALKWLRAEFTTKTDARNALGLRTIIDDSNFYNMLKIFALFVKLSGFNGLIICLDEMVNLFKISNTQSRNSNYEHILTILNDSLQGNSSGLGFIMGGTPEFLYDSRRGLYSYNALQSRLAENTFASKGFVDYSGPVIKLANLTPEDLYVLLINLRHVFAYGDQDKYLLPNEALSQFLEHCHDRIGEAYFKTPRNTIKSFLDLLSILEQNPNVSWHQLIGDVKIVAEDSEPNIDDSDDDFQLTNFKL